MERIEEKKKEHFLIILERDEGRGNIIILIKSLRCKLIFIINESSNLIFFFLSSISKMAVRRSTSVKWW